MNRAITSLFPLILISSLLSADSGKKVFESYCWGCHHQTATAFGPSFADIASKRSAQEIKAMITDPEGVSKTFGYKRNAMPKFNLKTDELDAITKYILSYKEVKKEEENITKEQNRTLEKGLYYMLGNIVIYKNVIKEEENISKEQNNIIEEQNIYNIWDKYRLDDIGNKRKKYKYIWDKYYKMELPSNYMFYYDEDNGTLQFEIIEQNKTIKEEPYPNIASKEHY